MPRMRLSQEGHLAQTQFRSFYDDASDLYEKAFTASNEKEVQTVLYTRALEDHLEGSNSDRPLRVLDVGCGRGTITRPIIEALGRSWPGRLELHGLDPSEEALTVYGALGALDGVDTLRAWNMTLEEFTENKDGQDPFDIILCDHSLYCVTSLDVLSALLDAMLSSSGVCLIAMASRFSPVSRYRRCILGVETRYSEDVLRHLMDRRRAVFRQRYHAQFTVTQESKRPVAAWISMEKAVEADRANSVLSGIGAEVEGCYLFENVCDLFIVPGTERSGDYGLAAAARTILHAQTAQDQDGREELFQPGSTLLGHLSDAVGFLECGSLVPAGGRVDAGALQGADVLPAAYNGYCATSESRLSMIENDLRSRLEVLRDTGFLAEWGLERLELEGLEDFDFTKLFEAYSRLIGTCVLTAPDTQLADDLREFWNRAGETERSLGALWLAGGEHTFYAMQAVLEREASGRSWEDVALLNWFSRKGFIEDGGFTPSKRFIRMVEWLRDLVADSGESEGLPTSLLDLRESCLSVGLNEDVEELQEEVDEDSVSGETFVALCDHIAQIDVNARAVPRVCYVVSAGMRYESPNLLILPVVGLPGGQSFGFVTCADLEDRWLRGGTESGVGSWRSAVVDEGMLAAIGVWKELFLLSLVSHYRERLSDEQTLDWVNQLKAVITSSDSGELYGKVRALPARILDDILVKCEQGIDSAGRQRNIVLSIVQFLFSPPLKFARESGESGRSSVKGLIAPDVQDSFWKAVGETHGPAIVFTACNSHEVREEEVSELVPLIERGAGRCGVILAREAAVSDAAKLEIQRAWTENSIRVCVLGDAQVKALLEAWSGERLPGELHKIMGDMF